MMLRINDFSHFHLESDVFATAYNAQIIILDLKKDKYIILNEEIASVLKDILTHKFLKNGNHIYAATHSDINQSDEVLNQVITHLRSLNILSKNDHNAPARNDWIKNDSSLGLENRAWEIHTKNLNYKVSFLEALEAYIVLCKVHYITKFKGFYGLAHLIRRNIPKTSHNPSVEALEALAKTLDTICLFFPKRTKCLEWAATYSLIAFQRGWNCQFVVGVQGLPFFAHAWVEAQGRIIADNPDLSNTLSAILKEPRDNQNLA